MKLIIVGASGCGREVLQIVKDINDAEYKWDVLGFIDDNLNALDGYECDYEVIGKIQDWQPTEEECFVMAIAEPHIKEIIAEKLEEKGAKFVSVIHPTAFIGSFNHIGRGIVVYPFAKITVNTNIGDFVTLLGSNIGHDAVVGDYCTISGMSAISGCVVLGKRVFIGGHVVIAPGKKIGDDAYVGNGSVVVTNIRVGYRVFGNPAKKMNL
jgi:sugar O-acyltransferase (sialic acid O-acetyltransferase NeuD family)